LTQSGFVLGTMSYCAPEQFRDAAHVDIRADIYSLGCTLYHLLTGKSPYWQRKTPAELVEAHLHEPFPKLAEEIPDPPAKLEAVLAHMTAKDREKRFSTPREVVDAMEPFARGAELAPMVPASPPKPQPGAPRLFSSPERQHVTTQVTWAKRQWVRIGAVLVLLLAIGGTLFVAEKSRREFRDKLELAQKRVGDLEAQMTALKPVITPEELESLNNERDSFVPKVNPVVLLMDTTSPVGIYDTDNIGKGGSNTKEARKALQELGLAPPLILHQQSVDQNWSGESFVRSLRPDLVIIHRSSFFHPLNAILNLTNSVDPAKWQAAYDIAEDKLISFMGYVASHWPRAQFLVYSRGTDPHWTNDFWRTNTWIKSVETRFPELKGRVIPMVVPQGYNGSFRKPDTRELLRSNVIDILKLPKKAK
jgi:hypothetical protein